MKWVALMVAYLVDLWAVHLVVLMVAAKAYWKVACLAVLKAVKLVVLMAVLSAGLSVFVMAAKWVYELAVCLAVTRADAKAGWTDAYLVVWSGCKSAELMAASWAVWRGESLACQWVAQMAVQRDWTWAAHLVGLKDACSAVLMADPWGDTLAVSSVECLAGDWVVQLDA